MTGNTMYPRVRVPRESFAAVEGLSWSELFDLAMREGWEVTHRRSVATDADCIEVQQSQACDVVPG